MDIIQIADTHNVKYEIPVEENPGFVVFTYENALSIIDKIRYECFPVAAIEVYIKRDFNFTCAFTCARRNGETMPQFTRRSCDEAIEYINNLNGDKNDYLYDIYVGDFNNVPMEVPEDNKELCEEDDERWSYDKMFLYVLGVDVIISLISFCIFPHDGFRAVVFMIVAFWGACVTGGLGLLFLFSDELRRIGKVLLANIIVFPVVMIGFVMFFLCHFFA